MRAKPREKLSRERVVDAALRVMDADGLDAVTMRRVGHELGVEAMSLYNHVRDKEDILDGVCERVMAEFEYPQTDERDWLETGRRAARAWRRLLKAHPNVIALFAERTKPMVSPEALRPMEFALSVLRGAGLSDRDALQAFHAFGGYIQGFVMMELGLWNAEGHAEFTLPAELFPSMAATMPHLVDCGTDEQFEFGLDLMLEGLRAKLA